MDLKSQILKVRENFYKNYCSDCNQEKGLINSNKCLLCSKNCKNEYKAVREYAQLLMDNFSNNYLFFAFSDDQLKEGLNKLAAEPKDVVFIGNGGFLLKEKKEEFKTLINSIELLKTALYNDAKYLYDAFYTEMVNYEYIFTYDDMDILNALNISIEEYNSNKTMQRMYLKARKDYLNDIEY